MSQQRVATSATADPGIQHPNGDGKEREEQVLSSPEIVPAAVSPECCSNLASPVSETVDPCPANVSGSEQPNVKEAARVTRRASKRKLEDASSPQGPVTETADQCASIVGSDRGREQIVENVAPVTGTAAKQRKLEETSAPQGSDVVGVNTGHTVSRSLPLRAHVASMIDTFQPHLLDLIEDTSDINLWLTFLAPKFEEGDNFGVDAQALVLEYVSSAAGAALDVLQTIQNYRDGCHALVLDNRGLRYYTDDFFLANEVLDQDQFYYLRKAMRELRDHYALLHDVIVKNWQLITQPRSEHARPIMF